MELELAVRRQITQAMMKKYRKATKVEKSAILDHLCEVNGWHRDHARKALRRAMAAAVGPPPAPRHPREPALTYGPALVEALRRHGELDITDQVAAQLVAMSAATIDRRLCADRAELTTQRGRSLTKPGSLLKHQIPMRTWADWSEDVAGFLEVDLVGHDGGDLNGQFCFTLTCTDIATGWTENRTVRTKAARWVFGALVELQAQFPFRILGIDSDNGSEFINHHLLGWCLDHQITFTRSRPNNSNDGAHVEQKNWAVARRTAGYWRYQTPGEMTVLNQIRTALSPLTNLFTPQQKLLSKTRVGAKITKKYDTAQTPYQRLLDHPDQLDDIDANPAALRRQVSDLQGDLLNKVRHQNITRRGKQNAAYLSRAKLDESTKKPTRAS